MNSFCRHHRDLIRFDYSCFDRLILNGCILPFARSERGGTIRWFLQTHRDFVNLSRAGFAKIAADYHGWVEDYALRAGLDIVEPEKGARREELVQPYFHQLGSRHGVAVILKAREYERVAWYFVKADHIAVERRPVNLYYFYLNAPHCGRMFVRICPYFPCYVSVWRNAI